MSLSLFNRNIAKCGKTIEIQKRTLGGSDFDSNDPAESFATIISPLALVKTIKGSKLFSGVQVVDDATHAFCMEYVVELDSVEQSNNFILFNNKRFRIVDVTNINELNERVIIQATERGPDSFEASKA